MAACALDQPRAAAEGRDFSGAGRHRSGRRRNRALRQNRSICPDQRVAARQRAARPPPLLADLCARARAWFAARHPCRRLWRPRAGRRRLAVLLRRGTPVECTYDGGDAYESGSRGRAGAFPAAQDRVHRGRVRLDLVDHVANGSALRTLPQRGAAPQAAPVRICARAFLVYDPADRRTRRSQTPAVPDRLGRHRSAAVLVGLSALGFRRSAYRHQDAADGDRTAQNLQRQRACALQALIKSMARHIVARTTEIPLGGNKVVTLEGRDIVVFHVNGEFFALLNRCPHAGAPLDKAACVARLTSPEPGVYQRTRVGELLRCAWHGWEFDMRNGQSWFGPNRFKVRTYPVVIEDGETLAKGPYVAETFSVHVEDNYVIVET